MLTAKLHIRTGRRGIDWVKMLSSERLISTSEKGCLVGEINPTFKHIRDAWYLRPDNAVINIHDFRIGKDEVTIEYEWLDTILGEKTYELFYQKKCEFFFVPRIVTCNRTGCKQKSTVITVDVYSHYVNPV